MGSRDASPAQSQDRARHGSLVRLPQVDQRRFMKDFSLPIIEDQLSAILLNTAQRNYELKNQHYNTLPVYFGKPN